MLLKKLYIENFKSYKKCEVDFEKGITIIIGPNGAGKTTLLDAISFALFKDGSVSDLQRRGLSSMRVELTFHSGEKIYRIVRERIKNRPQSHLYEIHPEQRLLATGEDETTLQIERILGMDLNIFRNSTYIRQGEIDSLLTARPAERKKIIGKLIGTEDLEVAFEGMKNVISSFESREEQIKDRLKEYENTEEKLRETQNEFKIVSAELSDLSRKIQKVESSFLAKKRMEEEEEKKRSDFQECKMKIEKRRYELCRTEDEVKEGERKLKEIESKKRRMEELLSSIKKIRIIESMKKLRMDYEIVNSKLSAEVGKMERILQEKESLLEELHGRRKELKETIQKESRKSTFPFSSVQELGEKREEYENRLKNRREKIDREYEHISSMIGALSGERKNLMDAVKSLEEATGKCPVCGAKLSEQHRMELIDEYKRRVKSITEEMGALRKKLEEFVNDKKKMEDELDSLSRINVDFILSLTQEEAKVKEKISRLQEELEKTRKSRDSLEIKELKRKICQIGEEERKLHSLLGYRPADIENELEIFREREREYNLLLADVRQKDGIEGKLREKSFVIEKLEKDIQELERRVEEIGYDEDFHSRIKKECEILQKELTSLSVGMARKEEKLSSLEERIKSLKEDLEKAEKLKNERERILQFVSFLEKIRRFFSKDCLQETLRIRAKPLIEMYANDVFSNFGLPFSHLTLQPDWDVVLSGNYEVTTDMISGGERIAVALSLRAGIAMALSGGKVELLMLDEPTVHLDGARRGELVQIVKNFTSIPQTIIVTHDEEFEPAATTVLKVKNENGISTVIRGGGNGGWTTMEEKLA